MPSTRISQLGVEATVMWASPGLATGLGRGTRPGTSGAPGATAGAATGGGGAATAATAGLSGAGGAAAGAVGGTAGGATAGATATGATGATAVGKGGCCVGRVRHQTNSPLATISMTRA